jgi:hypothetical protein
MSEQVSFACAADTREQSSATGECITAGDALRGCFECEEAALRRLLAKRGYQPGTRCSGR